MENEPIVREAFKKTLVELRKEKGLSQIKLADQSGLHRNYISFLETGENVPNIISLYKLAEALDVSVVEFIERIDKNI